MSERNFILYRSSAGSGKTYTLAREYLKLSLKNPESYKHILAVTFTNKATQEMKDRILHFLYYLSLGKELPMTRELQNYLQLDDHAMKERSRLVLANILHDYSFFSISTIDSFFQKIIRNFAKEIGLQSGFKLELDLDKVLDEVVDLLLLDISQNEVLKKWLVRFASEQVDIGKSWDISKEIKNLGRELFKENFKLIEKDIYKINQSPELIASYVDKIQKVKRTFEARAKQLGQTACSIMRDYDLSVDDFSYKKSGVMGYLEKLCSYPQSPGLRAKQAFRSEDQWYSKSSSKKETIQKAVQNGLDDVLGDVLSLFEKEFIKYQSASQILRFIYTYGIIAQINQKLKEYRDENGLLLISDATAFLKEIIAENDAPFIYEKTGAYYRNYLIDEFQDTSGFQWANFKPLISNSLAEGNPNLVVGDIKQSIYRWRGGDWKLLLEQISRDIGEHHTRVLNLNTNWRSKKNIIDFNNGLFHVAPQILTHLLIKRLQESEKLNDERLREALLVQARKLTLAYEDAYQINPFSLAPNDGFCGYVNMTFLESQNEGSGDFEEDDEEGVTGHTWKEEVARRIPLLMEKIQDQGYALKDVAILVRSKSEGKKLADCIMDYKSSDKAKPGYSYEVISSEALYISGSFCTILLINALRFLSNRKDQVARVHLIYEYQQYILKNEKINLHDLFYKAAMENEIHHFDLLPEEFLKQYSVLARLPLYELVEELIRIFTLSQLTGELPFVQAFQDMVLDFTQEERPDLASFLNFWDEKGHTHSVLISEKQDAVKIITIHKSKGLQFKNVIVPFCDWKLDHNTSFTNILWCKSSEPPFDEIEYLPLNYTHQLEDTIYQNAYFEEMIKARMDHLNVLYVAFTRAEDCLYVFGQKPKVSSKGVYPVKCVSSLLYYVFNEGYLEDKFEIKVREELSNSRLKDYWKTEQTVFELGQKEIDCKTELVQEIRTSNLTSYMSSSWRNRLSIRTRARDFFTKDSRQKINYGILMHQILSRIITIDQIPEVLQELYFDGNIEKEDVDIISQQIDQIFQNALVKDWFTGGWEVKTEAPVLPHSGDLKRFDRVMIRNTHAIVVDFKSGFRNPSHQKQIMEYAQLLKEMDYSPVEGYLVYLAEAEVERVV